MLQANLNSENDFDLGQTPTSTEGLRENIISGVVWAASTQTLGLGARFLVTVVLARLLLPKDFGLVAMIIVFTGFASLFKDFGFSSALIQRDRIEGRHYSSVFWVNLATGVVLAAVMIASAPLIARFYSEPLLVPMISLIAVNFPISALGLVQKAALHRKMDFRSMGLIELWAVIISGGVAIALALSGFGVWSLVWQTLLATLLTVVGVWWVTGWRPRWVFDRNAVADLFGFSANLLGFSIVNYFLRNADNLLVGKYFGSAALGIYGIAYNLMLLPLSQVTWVVSSVMFPALSRLQNEKMRVKSIYLRTVSMIALVTFPVMLGLLAVTDHFILALYGPVWARVIPVLRILCILGMLQSVSTTVGLIFQSQGRTDWMFWWGCFSGAVSITGIIIGVWMGTLEAVATCLLVAAIILLPHSINIPGKLIGITLRDVAESVLGVLACAAAMASSVWVLGTSLPPSWPHWTYLCVQVPFGIAVYALLVHLFQLASYQELRKMVVRQVQAGFSPAVLPVTLRD